MEWINILMARLRALFRRESVLRDIEEELRVHVEMETETNIKRGMPPDEARAAALKSFGDLGRNTELGYDIRGGGWLETLWQDLRYGVRMLMKNPGFTLVAVVTLALGIGANTAIFSLINSILLNPLPYEQADRLAEVWDNNAGLSRQHEDVSPGNYHDLCNAPGIFESSAAWYVTARTLTGEQDAEQAQCALVTPDFFTTLRVQAASGRLFRQRKHRERR